MRAATLSLKLAAAREQLEGALIDHWRKHAASATEMNLARSDLDQSQKLADELHVARALINTLAEQRDLLRRKQAQFELLTPPAGTVFGAELLRLVGHYFKGAEICRVADARQLLLRIQVPEREIGDMHFGQPVRLNARAFPECSFYGTVSKIGNESEPDESQQATYRVELMVENEDGSLRSGMTTFVRIEFGRQMMGHILLHKFQQAVRPELWLL